MDQVAQDDCDEPLYLRTAVLLVEILSFLVKERNEFPCPLPVPHSVTGQAGRIRLCWNRGGYMIETDPDTVHIFYAAVNPDAITFDWPLQKSEFVKVAFQRINL